MTAEARTSAWGAKSRRRLRQFCVANTGHCLFQKCVNGFEREQSSAHHAAKSAFADSDPSCQSSVLLRVARPDALAPIAEPQPPDRQLRQIVKAVGTGERQTIIAADRRRQAALGKDPLEGVEHALFARRFKGFAGEQKARGLVGDVSG